MAERVGGLHSTSGVMAALTCNLSCGSALQKLALGGSSFAPSPPHTPRVPFHHLPKLVELHNYDAESAATDMILPSYLTPQHLAQTLKLLHLCHDAISSRFVATYLPHLAPNLTSLQLPHHEPDVTDHLHLCTSLTKIMTGCAETLLSLPDSVFLNEVEIEYYNMIDIDKLLEFVCSARASRLKRLKVIDVFGHIEQDELDNVFKVGSQEGH